MQSPPAPEAGAGVPPPGASAPGDLPPAPSPPAPSDPAAARARAAAAALLVFALALGMYLPYSGSYGLWDPWEGHYAEVARQMVEREPQIGAASWIELHWHNGTGPEGRKENVFWSKPVLTFWLMAVPMRLLGMNDPARPGEMTDPGVEWALRWPFVLLGAFAVWAVALAVARLVGRRAGVLAGVILATSPQFFFIARQAMTDMPFVAPMTAALCFFLLAMFAEDGEREARRARLAFWAAFALVVVPQVALLVTGLRTTVRAPGWLPLWGGASVRLLGWLHAAPYLVTAAAAVLVSRRARSARQQYLFLFYLLCAVAMLAKGLPGPALPGLVILVYLVVSGEWWILGRAEIPRGALIFASAALPWYHGMLAREGQGFWNEFFGHHHLKRLTAGVHGDKGTVEYFLHQAGIAMFPWSALAPAALAHVAGASRPRDAAGRLRLFCAVWALAAFTLFSLAVTKFHHYILPVLPPLAILIALFLDDLCERRVRGAAVAVLSALGLLVFLARDLVTEQQRLIWLFVYNYQRAWPEGYQYGRWLLGLSIAAGLCLAALGPARLRRAAAFCLALAAVAFTWFALNKYMVEISPHWSQKEVLATYYRLRAGPEEELIAWQMNWRGETFYTKAEVAVAMSLENDKFVEYVREREGRRLFFLCERGRYGTLRSVLPTDKAKKTLRIADGRSNKFYLVVSEI